MTMEYKLIPEDKYQDVILHLRKTFFWDEPLNKAAKLCQPGETNQELERHSLQTLADAISLMAVNEDGEIAGVVLNGTLRPGDTKKAQKQLANCNDENFKKIFNLLNRQNLENDLFELHSDVEKIFDIRILSVDPKFRGLGIARELIRQSEILARGNDFKVMKADGTGILSQKILKSFGFEDVSEIYYSDYVDDNGIPILNVEPCHKKLQLMQKILD